MTFACGRIHVSCVWYHIASVCFIVFQHVLEELHQKLLLVRTGVVAEHEQLQDLLGVSRFVPRACLLMHLREELESDDGGEFLPTVGASDQESGLFIFFTIASLHLQSVRTNRKTATPTTQRKLRTASWQKTWVRYQMANWMNSWKTLQTSVRCALMMFVSTCVLA